MNPVISYDGALQIIAGMAHHKWRQGLDRMEAFVGRAGLTPALSEPRYLHVAGTNGKGSVTATLHHVLAAHGVPCGAYFSPYVFDFRERIQADLALIPRDDLARLVERLLPVAASFVGTEFGEISEFEFKTALALAFWAERG
ncbi:MAG: bifunctional folylpolyglutamate synthase/dihydrofolate synthase, partial [Fimbriimonadaceae bacterium]|nr:bifunctional folylpolyglutamate synthase/dihydrofolate synthase [Fimbriimonadaceae bacterium]